MLKAGTVLGKRLTSPKQGCHSDELTGGRSSRMLGVQKSPLRHAEVRARACFPTIVPGDLVNRVESNSLFCTVIQCPEEI
jgi:hypothetical protein